MIKTEKKVKTMKKYDNLVFVDVEATGLTPYSGVMTEFGCVHYGSNKTFHGVLHDSMPDPANPAKPVLTGRTLYDHNLIAHSLKRWLTENVNGKPVFVSDNPAYDFMWMAYFLDVELGQNPFGHSARRISDFWAGFQNDWSNTQKWKRFRVTPHDHNPVNDSLGNVEAFRTIMSMVDTENEARKFNGR